MKTLAGLICAIAASFIISAPAWAITIYADATPGADCVGTYSFAARACSGAATSYNTVAECIRALAIGDTCEIRSGSYTLSSIYGNVATDTWGGIGTSWETATKIINTPGEAVTVSGGGLNMSDAAGFAGIAYLIFEGDTRANFVLDDTDPRVNSGNSTRAVHHVRFKRLTIRNNDTHGITGGGSNCATQKPHHIEILDNLIQTNGDSSSGVAHEHGIYPACSDSWLVQGNELDRNFAYGIHFYSASAGFHTNNIVERNFVHGRRSTAASGTAFGVIFASGSGNTARRNVVVLKDGAGVRLSGGVRCSTGTTTCTLYHNTVYGESGSGIGAENQGSGTLIKNNIFDDVSDAISEAGTSTVDFNLCPTASCDTTGATNTIATATPGFVTPGTDFSLAAGSAAINAGVAITGLSYNGSAPDVGAFETVPRLSCTIENGDASTVRQTFESNVFPPIRLTNATGVTTRRDAANNAVTAVVVVGSTRLDVTVTTAISAGETIDTSYAQTGDLRDSANIGGSMNQEVLAYTNQSCTNNVGAPATHVFTAIRYEWHALQGSEAAPVLMPYDCVTCAANGTLENYVGMWTRPGGSVRLRIAVQASIADPPPTGFLFWYARNGGAITLLPATFGSDNIAYCGTSVDPDIPQDFIATTNQLSTTGTFAAGALLRTPNAIPTVDIANSTGKTELEVCATWDTDTAPDDFYDFYIKQQDGTAIVNTVIPRITVRAASAGMGF